MVYERGRLQAGTGDHPVRPGFNPGSVSDVSGADFIALLLGAELPIDLGRQFEVFL